ncbi:unnamed protein product, partial [Iphiclides podalirius]
MLSRRIQSGDSGRRESEPTADGHDAVADAAVFVAGASAVTSKSPSGRFLCLFLHEYHIKRTIIRASQRRLARPKRDKARLLRRTPLTRDSAVAQFHGARSPEANRARRIVDNAAPRKYWKMRSAGEFGVLETRHRVQRPAVRLGPAKNALPHPTPNAVLSHRRNYIVYEHTPRARIPIAARVIVWRTSLAFRAPDNN